MQVLKDQVSQKILSVSQKLFLKHGYLETTLQMIADDAGVSKSNLYNYFKNKETIFKTLTLSALEDINTLLYYFESIEYDLDKDDALFIKHFIEHIHILIKSNKDAFLLLLQSSKGTEYEQTIERLLTVFTNKFKRRIKNSSNPELVAKVLATNFIQGIISIIKYSQTNEELYDCLKAITNYHTYGIKVLFT